MTPRERVLAAIARLLNALADALVARAPKPAPPDPPAPIAPSPASAAIAGDVCSACLLGEATAVRSVRVRDGIIVASVCDGCAAGTDRSLEVLIADNVADGLLEGAIEPNLVYRQWDA